MKKVWLNVKKPLLWLAVLTTFSLLFSALLIRNFGILFSPLLGDIAPYFYALTDAVIRWNPLWMPLVVLAGGALLYYSKMHFVLSAVMTGVFLLLAGILLMRVNSVPVIKLISVVLSLVRGGVL